jgi:hypothetical protein
VFVDYQSMAVCLLVMAVHDCHKCPSSGKLATAMVPFPKDMLVQSCIAFDFVSVVGNAMTGIRKLFFARCFTQLLPTH